MIIINKLRTNIKTKKTKQKTNIYSEFKATPGRIKDFEWRLVYKQGKGYREKIYC